MANKKQIEHIVFSSAQSIKYSVDGMAKLAEEALSADTVNGVIGTLAVMENQMEGTLKLLRGVIEVRRVLEDQVSCRIACWSTRG